MRVRKPAAAVLFFLFVFSFIAVLSLVPKVQSATTNITVSADSWTNSDNPTVNYGTDANLWLQQAPDMYVWLKFDLSGLPTGIYVSSAKLYLYTTDIYNIGDGYSRTGSDDNWAENTITWNNQPGYSSVIESKQISTASTWYYWTVTSQVNTEYSGNKIITFAMTGYSIYVRFASREYDSLDPYLEVTYTYYPKNDSLSLTNPSIATQGVLAMKQAYTFRLVISDGDGYANFNYAELTLDYGGLNLRVRWTEGTDVFSEQYDPNNYITSLSGSVTILSATQLRLDFQITFAWSYPDENLHTVRAYALDDNSLSDTDDYANIYYVENDLVSSGRTVSDTNRVNPSQSLTFSGTIYYEGTAITPPDGNYNVQVKLSGVVKGTDTTLVSGQFSTTFNAESSVASYTYNVDFTYELAGSSDTFSAVIVDKIVVTIATNSTNPSNTEAIELTTSAKYQYDNTDVSTLSFQMTRNGSNFATTTPVTDGPYTALRYVYTISSASETTHGLTAFSTNTITVTWGSNVFIEAWQIIVDKTRADINSNVYIRYRLRFGNNQSVVDSGTIWINGTSHTISSGWANFTVTSSTVGKKPYVETAVDVNGEQDYGQIPADPEIIWDRLEFVSVATEDTHINMGATFELRYTIRYDYDDVPFSSGKGSVSGFTWDNSNGWWKKTVTGAATATLTNYDETYVAITDSTYALTVKQDVAGVNVITDGLKLSVQNIDLANKQLLLRLLYAYDDSSVSNGNVTFAGFYALSNSSGWAVFNLASLTDFEWGQTSYGVQDSLYGITYKSQNQTIPVRKISGVIIETPSDLTLSSSLFQNNQLFMSLSGSGTKAIKVSWVKPYYVKIGSTVYLEGTAWTYDPTNAYTTITTSYSTQDIMVSGVPLATSESTSGGSLPPKPKTIPEEIVEAVSTAVFTLASNYVGVIIFILCLVGFILSYFYSRTTTATFLAAATIYMLFDLVSVFILIPQQLFPSDLMFLQPFLWVPPSLVLDVFGPLAVQQLIQVMMMGSLFAILAAAVYGVTQR
jgi:hypothetical protein